MAGRFTAQFSAQRQKGAEVAPRRPVIYLHIGAMKTGTTFLQGLMVANQDSLAAAGYLFPGSRWYEQARAVRDILRMNRHDLPMRALCDGMWDKIAAEMLGFHGRASILSMEFLSFANARQAARVTSSLDGAELHVILTVRDAVGAIPAQWQTHCRNGGTVSWPTFARSARRGARFGRLSRGQGARVFEKAQGVPRMLRAWGRAVPPERLHVVTVPASGSDPMLLWDRFARVVGVDPAVASVSNEKTNPSLGQPSAELMRRINAKLGRLPASEYQPTLKAQLATNVLTGRAGIETGPRLDGRTRAFALAWNHRTRRAIERSGSDIVGDLADLPVEPPENDPGAAEAPSDPEAEDLLAAAATARDGLLRLIRRRTKRLSEIGRAVDAPAPGADAAGDRTPASRWDAAADPVGAAVTELTGLARVAIGLQQQVVSAGTDSP